MRLMSRLGPGRRGAYLGGLSAVVLAYCVVLGGLLAFTDGLPYVLDNNETFSSLMHARSMMRFGVRETLGLTDEAFGPAPAQHPYIYTHGGNFPRFYTLLLFVLGARTAEAQIVATTFTVGLVGVLLAYHYFSRVATPLFSLVYCLLLITDQVMQTQWLVSTWRTWHHFFVFSSLVCVDRLMRSRRVPRLLAAVTLLNFACLLYLEVVFATFVTLLASVYAGLIGWRRPRRIVRTWLLVATGFGLGAAALMAQLIGYLGWDGFCTDVRLTFLARNAAAVDLRAFRSEVWSFVDEHRIVFWDNFLAGSGTYSGFFRWCLLPYTPLLVFIALLLSAAFAMSLTLSRGRAAVSSRSRWTWSGRSAVPWLTVAAGAFACAVLRDASFAGLTETRGLGRIGMLIACLAVGALGVALHRRLRDREVWLSASRVVGGVALLLGLAVVARFHPRFYGDGLVFMPLFRELIGRTGGVTVWSAAVLGTALLALGLVLTPPSVAGGTRPRFHRLGQLVVAGVIAIASVFALFPGYVASGYLTRYCPLTVHVHLIPFAVAFYVLARMSRFSLSDWSGTQPPSPHEGGGRLVILVVAFALLCLLSGYWVTLQARWITGLDPRAPMLKELQKPEYRGASVVVNAYAAPAAFLTGGWAYYDPQLGKSELRMLDGGFYLRRDFRYLLLADKYSNKAYFEPDYFVCFTPRQLIDVIGVPEKCQELSIVAEARAGTSLLGHREVARDESGRDSWSIIRLSWTYPPGSGIRIRWDDRQYRRALALPW
jgi:hypothetical protein